MASMAESGGLSEVLFEFHRVGNSLRVAAIDPVSNVEVTLVAPIRCGEGALKRLALRKLAHVLGKRTQQPASRERTKKA